MGDTVESIRSYDPATQRSIASLDQASIEPLQELIAGDDETPDRTASALDYLSASGRPVVLVSEPDEVRAQGEKAWGQIQASHEETLAKGVRAPAPGDLMLEWPAVARWLEAATTLETLEIGGADGQPAHIACQPAVEFGGRITDWVAEIRRSRERGDTIVFVANSAGRAEFWLPTTLNRPPWPAGGTIGGRESARGESPHRRSAAFFQREPVSSPRKRLEGARSWLGERACSRSPPSA